MSVILKSSDSQSVEFGEDLVKLSEFLQEKSKDKSAVIDFPQNVLVKVKEYLENIEEAKKVPIPKTLEKSTLKENVGEWNANYIDIRNFEIVFNLINAGLIFKLDHLHDLACAKVAQFMKDNSPEEVQKEFTIECQITSEEAKELGLGE
jgi:hypothetical protein